MARIEQNEKKSSQSSKNKLSNDLHSKTGQVPIAVDTDTAAELIGIPSASLASMRVRGGGPQYSKVRQRVVYRVADLDEWLVAHTIRNTADTRANDDSANRLLKRRRKGAPKRGGGS